METQIVQITQFRDPEMEAKVLTVRNELTEIAELQGKHDGLENKPKTVPEHTALFLNKIEVTVQPVIDYMKKKYLPLSGVAGAKLAEIEGDKKEKELQSLINDDEHRMIELKKSAVAIKPIFRKVAHLAFWVLCGLGVLSLLEGGMSYNPFRYINFPVVVAIIACAAIAIGVFLGAHHSAGYIKAAKDQQQTMNRYFACMMPAVVVFSALAMIRAGAINHVSTVQVGAQHVTSQSHGTASAFGIALISITLYFLALFISVKYHRPEEEIQQERAYDEKCKEIDALQAGIDQKNNQIVMIRYEKAEKMNLALQIYEYCKHMEIELINMAQEIAEAYKQKNMRFRKEGFPSFFSNKPVFNFRLFFNKQNNTDTGGNNTNDSSNFENNNSNYTKKTMSYEIH